MKYVILNASIECKGADIVSRNIPNKPTWVNEPKLGLCKHYICTDKSQVTITKELKPKKAIIDDKSQLDLGDRISGNAILVVVAAKSDLEYEVHSKSGRHKAQFASTRHFTYAKILTQLYASREVGV
jgi:hypothetical protein